MQNTGLLNRLEKKLGKYAIKNLIVYILIGYAIGYAMFFLSYRTNIYQYIVLDPALVMQGQVWRLFSWVLTVPQTLSIWVIFMFVFYYFIGKSLENTIGTFKYNLFMFSGWFFITLGCMAVYWISTAVNGPGLGITFDASTYYLNLASFLVFAVLYPDTKVYIFFVIPLKMIWLAVFDVIYLIIEIVQYVITIGKIDTIDFTDTGITAMQYRIAIYAQIFCIIVSLLNVGIFLLIYRKSMGNTFKDRLLNMKRRKKFNQSKQAGEQTAFAKQQEAQINRWQENLKKQQEKQNSSVSDEQKTEFEENPWMTGWGQWYDPNMSPEERERIQKEYDNRIAAEEQAKLDKKNEELKRKAEEKENRIINKRKEYTSKYSQQVYQHKCEICGRTNVSDPDLVFRFCSKCDGNHEYCQDHIFNHEHIHN